MHAGLRRRRLVVLAGTVAVVAMTSLVLPGIASAWSWPVDGAVLRPFSLGSDTYAGGQHRGIDVAGADGEGVRAPSEGSVTFAGTVPGSGRTVSILTADGYSVTLSHLGTIQVSKGDMVSESSVIATVGRSGTSEHAEAYLHLGVRVATQDQGYLDPLGLLPARASDQPTGGEPTAVPDPVADPGTVASAAAPEPPSDGQSPGLVSAPTPVDTAGSISPAQPAIEENAPEQPSGSSSAAPLVADGPASTSPVQGSGSSSGTTRGSGPALAATTAQGVGAGTRAAGKSELPTGSVEATSSRTSRATERAESGDRQSPATNAFPSDGVSNEASATANGLVGVPALGPPSRRRSALPQIVDLKVDPTGAGATLPRTREAGEARRVVPATAPTSPQGLHRGAAVPPTPVAGESAPAGSTRHRAGVGRALGQPGLLAVLAAVVLLTTAGGRRQEGPHHGPYNR